MKLRKTHVLWIPLLVCLFLVNGVNVMAAIEQDINGNIIKIVLYIFELQQYTKQ